MATFKDFEELEIFQLARRQCQLIWQASREGSFARDFALLDQINRASGSVMDNIAEGQQRGGNKEFSHFLSIARGSNGEVRSQLMRAQDRTHITSTTAAEIITINIEIGVKTTRLMQHLGRSKITGAKFKTEK